MTPIVAWAVFPLVMVAACLGTGLLAERLAGVRLPPALVAPLGFCAAMAIVGPGFALGAGAGTALAVLGLATAAGFWLGRTGLRERFRPGLGAAAGGAAYALYIAPVALSGEATFLGYNFLNDTAVHLGIVDYLSEFGRKEASLPPSTFASYMAINMGSSYPVAAHELLATLKAALDIEPARVYQPYLAVATGLAATALFAMLRGAGAPRAAAAAGAVAALASHLLFSFNLQGGIKELTFVATLATVAALGAEAIRHERPVRLAALLGLPFLAGFGIYALPALAWLGPLAVCVVAFAFAVPGSPLRRRLVPAALAAALVFAVPGLPTVIDGVAFYTRGGGELLTSPSELGPLAGQLRKVQLAGIWLNGDYRHLPSGAVRRTYLLIGIALALAALGAAHALRRRLAGPLLFLLPSLTAWVVVSPRASPYIDAKLLAVLSPAVVLFSCLGVAALWQRRARLEAAGAALVLAGALAVSDVLAYRFAAPAPMDRLQELAEIADRFRGRGQLLVNEWEEYAKHFAREAQAVNPYETFTPAVAEFRGGDRPRFGNAYTLDDLTFEFVNRFDLIAVRRSPAESRPPASYSRVFAGRYYEVWGRTGPPAAVAHEPFGTAAAGGPLVSAAGVPDCGLLARLAADHDLVGAVRPQAVVFDIARDGPLPAGWVRDPGVPGALNARRGGSVSAEGVTGSGRHRAWVKGRIFRATEVRVDGRPVGVVKDANGPNQWLDAGTIDLRAGSHRVELLRPARSLAPGGGRMDIVGPVVLVEDRDPELVRAPSGNAGRLCGRPLDWVEQVAPAGRR